MPLALGLVELIDDDGRRKRQLVACMLQDLLPNGLGHQHALRLIGQVVVWKERLAFRQPLEQHSLEPVDAVALSRPTRERSRQSRARLRLARSAAAARLCDQIDLIEHEHDRLLDVLQQPRHVLVAVARLASTRRTRA